ncbi:MAG: ABC transporter permease [Micropruina sp.]|uniref:ABC transporter permease n=1 Tax=Micropruina sp. TaxID=2737536 RepID=UPI0039E64074
MTTLTTHRSGRDSRPARAIDDDAPRAGSARVFLHYTGQSILTQLRDWAFLGFVIVMPTTIYLFFASIYGDEGTDSGFNVAALMMVMMATYGGLGAAMNAGSQIQSERSSGWFRQLMLTSLTPAQFVAAKVITAVAVVIPAIVTVFIAGAARGVRLDAGSWAASLGLIVASLLPMVVFGLVIALWFKPQTATAATTLAMLVLAMLGGLWFPLDMMPEAMQTVGRTLPSYWANQIGSWPLTGGDFPWQGVWVLGCWLLALVVIGALGYRRAIRTSRR